MWWLLLACSGSDSDPPDSGTDTDPPEAATLAEEASASVVGAEFLNIGWSVGAAGDVDGDGAGDLLLGSSTGNQGCLWLAPVQGALSFEDADCIVGATGDFLGQNTVGMGDLNGDGLAEYGYSAIGFDGGGLDRGAVTLISGDQVSQWVGELDLDGAGVSFATVGDVDGDGEPDWVVGAPGSDVGGDSAGAAYLIRGPLVAGSHLLADADARIEGVGQRHGAVVGVATGGSVSGGDFDGDGLSDLLISAGGSDALGVDAGMVGVFLGPLSGNYSFADADARYFGDVTGGYLGEPLGKGDIDGDGREDVILSKNGSSPEELWIFTDFVPTERFRSGARTIIQSAHPGDRATWSFTTLEANDGPEGLVIGAPWAFEQAGAVYVLNGPIAEGTWNLQDSPYLTGAPGDLAGQAVAAPGDASGDGIPDVWIGAPYAEGGLGAAYLVSLDRW